MNTVTLTIDGQKVTVPENTSILDAAKKAGIDIPTLCYFPDQNIKGNCRVCVVEVEGSRTLAASCSTPVNEGMAVKTWSKNVMNARRTIVQLMLADHDEDCNECVKNGVCELQSLAQRLNIQHNPFKNILKPKPIDTSTPSLIRNPNKCVKCGRCVDMCQETQQVGILFDAYRGADSEIVSGLGKYLSDAGCILCGQCSTVCPVAAIYENDETDKVWQAIFDTSKRVIVQTAPAIRVSIAEEFDMLPGTVALGQLAAGLRRLGFDDVFDTDFAADLTIMEEGHELLDRLQHGGMLPMITSCSPGWINFIEQYYPDLLPHLSTCKSPQQMFGSIAKTYYAQKIGLKPEDIFVVSIMPCTAKKYESGRPEMNDSGVRDVDVALTTRELARMIRQAGIDFTALPEEPFDEPLGISTGAGAIFGATGGVMEAALRTVYEVVTGNTLPSLDFTDVRGLKGIKEASVDLDDVKVNVAVAHGIANAKKLLELIRNGAADYQFIEIMCCPGGCIGGGGQPYRTTNAIRQQRIKAIYEVDKAMPLRKSHENPAVQALYEEFLGRPLSEKSHHLLHTTYSNRQH
ncbi:NADH-dependent [FeFe] hydrogenase, group A6 [Mahella sp.]|uniref:NADH-dependent [FeFe] hydrogenase, group A6 n=1 Tax=Mahella sp. TaxID=2798721 RepID=UPI0025BDCA63|nr:NADH-dependent [FeFe] hydrogenase, group A6 [Mahella sp.]MBZ4664777.1 NAD(P)-dependent iron-only hydrogenase catalytic subunit [Mahella sp.]MDK2903388.1 NADP-reducing hydrogenase subunit HndD [Clostridiales bacterium]